MKETRSIEQVKLYMLYLNSMHGKSEESTFVAVSYSREDLYKWYISLKESETYKDDGYTKSFSKGSFLEGFNDMEWNDNCGIREDWAADEDMTSYIVSANNSFGFVFVPEDLRGKS